MGLFGKKKKLDVSAENIKKDKAVCPVCEKPLVIGERYCRFCGVKKSEEQLEQGIFESELIDLFGFKRHCDGCGHRFTVSLEDANADVYCPDCGRLIPGEKPSMPSEQAKVSCCPDCKSRWIEGEPYCRYCGARKETPGIKTLHSIGFIYGPAPVERTHICKACGYTWTTNLMIDEERCCPKCGGLAPVEQDELQPKPERIFDFLEAPSSLEDSRKNPSSIPSPFFSEWLVPPADEDKGAEQ